MKRNLFLLAATVVAAGKIAADVNIGDVNHAKAAYAADPSVDNALALIELQQRINDGEQAALPTIRALQRAITPAVRARAAMKHVAAPVVEHAEPVAPIIHGAPTGAPDAAEEAAAAEAAAKEKADAAAKAAAAAKLTKTKEIAQSKIAYTRLKMTKAVQNAFKAKQATQAAFVKAVKAAVASIDGKYKTLFTKPASSKEYAPAQLNKQSALYAVVVPVAQKWYDANKAADAATQAAAAQAILNAMPAANKIPNDILTPAKVGGKAVEGAAAKVAAARKKLSDDIYAKAFGGGAPTDTADPAIATYQAAVAGFNPAAKPVATPLNMLNAGLAELDKIGDTAAKHTAAQDWLAKYGQVQASIPSLQQKAWNTKAAKVQAM